MTRRLEVLISCMDQSDVSIAEKSNIASDAVIINQCGKNSYDEAMVSGHRVRMFSCTDRGLSKSRNRAISESAADICLLCDNDEQLEDRYPVKILQAYEANPDADVIAFKVQYPFKTCWKRPRRVGRLDALKICSWQITFKRESLAKHAIYFDERFGPGTKYSPQEEIIFLYDCLNKGLKIYYVPELIAVVGQEKSTWFEGYTENYFINRGITTRFFMGGLPATLYALYYATVKYPLYRKEISFLSASKNMLKGIYSQKIGRPY